MTVCACNRIVYRHVEHEPTWWECGACQRHFLPADAVAQAVKERDKTAKDHMVLCVEAQAKNTRERHELESRVERMTEERDDWKLTASELAKTADQMDEEIARQERTIMRHESDRAVREKEIARLRAYRCPNCVGAGWTTQADPHTGDACQVQCERCYATGIIDLPAIIQAAVAAERAEVERLRTALGFIESASLFHPEQAWPDEIKAQLRRIGKLANEALRAAGEGANAGRPPIR